MKRSAPLKRTGFKPRNYSSTREPQPSAEVNAIAIGMLAVPTGCRKVSYAVINGQVRAVSKPAPKRNPALLEMARGRQCLMCAPGTCHCTPGSVVAAHSNLGIHGKAKGRKADDCYSVWAGFEAHQAYDQGPASAQAKEAAFMAAHLRQVLEWRRIAQDTSEPERFRNAAQWALKELNAL